MRSLSIAVALFVAAALFTVPVVGEAGVIIVEAVDIEGGPLSTEKFGTYIEIAQFTENGRVQTAMTNCPGWKGDYPSQGCVYDRWTAFWTSVVQVWDESSQTWRYDYRPIADGKYEATVHANGHFLARKEFRVDGGLGIVRVELSPVMLVPQISIEVGGGISRKGGMLPFAFSIANVGGKYESLKYEIKLAGPTYRSDWFEYVLTSRSVWIKPSGVYRGSGYTWLPAGLPNQRTYCVMLVLSWFGEPASEQPAWACVEKGRDAWQDTSTPTPPTSSGGRGGKGVVQGQEKK